MKDNVQLIGDTLFLNQDPVAKFIVPDYLARDIFERVIRAADCEIEANFKAGREEGHYNGMVEVENRVADALRDMLKKKRTTYRISMRFEP